MENKGDQVKNGISFITIILAILVLLFHLLPGNVCGEENEFKVVSTTPEDGEEGVSSSTTISIVFSSPVNESTLIYSSFIVMNTLDGDYFDSGISYDNTTYTVTLDNFEHHGRPGIHRGANMEVKLLNIEDINGNSLVGSDGMAGSNYVFHFEVEEKEEEAGDSPGFDLLILMAAVTFAVAVLYARKR